MRRMSHHQRPAGLRGRHRPEPHALRQPHELRRGDGPEQHRQPAQLARPDGKLGTAAAYDEIFTMHGITMIFLVVMPLGAAFANYLLPLMIGARDVAFPRLNAFSYWLFLFAGLFLYSGFFLGGAPNGGWFSYQPLASQTAIHGDFYAL